MFLAPLAASATAAVGGAAGLAAIGTAVSVGAGVLQTVNSVQQAKFQERLANQNAAVADQNRIQALRDSAQQAQDKDIEASQQLGALIAQQAASGLSGGSHTLQRKSLQTLAQRDRQRISEGGEAVANRFGQQALDFRTEASSASAAGSNAITSGLLGVGSSLIGGASQIAKLQAIGAA